VKALEDSVRAFACGSKKQIIKKLPIKSDEEASLVAGGEQISNFIRDYYLFVELYGFLLHWGLI
jgi:hypothetical protein